MAKKKIKKIKTKAAAVKSPAAKKPKTAVVKKIAVKKPAKVTAKPVKRVVKKTAPVLGVARKAVIDVESGPIVVKSPLSTKELKAFRVLLLHKRAEILGDMTSMSRDALNSDSANLSHMPIHMADVGSDHYEQELTLGLVESERKMLQEIDEALQRIADKTFGACEATGKPIGKARLAAKPWAKYCIEAAREFERHGGGR